MISDDIRGKISTPLSQAEKAAFVDKAVEQLGVVLPEYAREFYRLFCGPESSENSGYQLLDMVSGKPSVVWATNVLRDKFTIPTEWLVLSDVVAGGWLLYNTKTDKVYDVDFEGTLQRVMRGGVAATWDSFAQLLEEFYSEIE